EYALIVALVAVTDAFLLGELLARLRKELLFVRELLLEYAAPVIVALALERAIAARKVRRRCRLRRPGFRLLRGRRRRCGRRAVGGSHVQHFAAFRFRRDVRETLAAVFVHALVDLRARRRAHSEGHYKQCVKAHEHW